MLSRCLTPRSATIGASLLLVGLLAVRVVADEPAGAARASDRPLPADAPVILLTGFEPFGPGRPPNPSWEAVQPLDGRSWNGYRLVARQLPCVWGQPLEKLQEHVTKLKPVAIFSFGQGAPGAFAIETRASNRRGSHPDNAGKAPGAPEVVAGGPAEFTATIDADRLRTLLVKKGHDVRISRNAGRYLCEECLFTLEHLKSKHVDVKQVMFCHVPPLDGKQVTPEFVRAFVLDVLDAWRTTYAAADGPAPAKGASPCGDEPTAPPTAGKTGEEPPSKSTGKASGGGAAKPTKEDPRTADVKKFINRYFTSWSNREMDAYGELFLREAVVQFLDERGGVNTQETPEFLADQRRFQSLRPAKEYPLAADIRFEGPLARAVVHWKLEDGINAPRYGYDHFTLLRRDGQWRIVNLVFYGTDPPKNGK